MKQNILDECLPNEEMDWNGHPWNMLFHANTIHIAVSVLKKCSWWRCPIIMEFTLSCRDSLHLKLWFLTNSSVHTKTLNTMEMELCNITILELNCTFSPFLSLRDWDSLIILDPFANIPIGIFGILVLQPIYI